MRADKKFARSIKKLLDNNRSAEMPAFLGNHSGVVKTDVPGMVYATILSGDVVTVYNGAVPNVSRLPVYIGYNNGDKLQVIRSRNSFVTPPYPDVPAHAELHTFPGADTIPINNQQIIPGLVEPYSGLNVLVHGCYYELSGGWYAIPSQNVDLSAHVPASGALYALLELDDTGSVNVTLGSTVAARDALVFGNIPAKTTGMYQLAAVKLYAGQTSFVFTLNDTDIIDLRFGKLGGGTGGGGAYQRVLSSTLALADGESLVISGYINQGSYNVTLAGDAVLHIL